MVPELLSNRFPLLFLLSVQVHFLATSLSQYKRKVNASDYRLIVIQDFSDIWTLPKEVLYGSLFVLGLN